MNLYAEIYYEICLLFYRKRILGISHYYEFVFCFAGTQCEVDMETKRYEVCPLHVCKGTSECTPLIRGGFRCELCPTGGVSGGSEQSIDRERCVNCADMEENTKYCELKTRSFTKGTFLTYPSLKRRHRFTIKMR